VTLADDLKRTIEVYPPMEARPSAPLVVFLHATCMDPRPVCDLVGTSAREGTFLVCPSGNATCFGAPDWHGTGEEKSAFLTSALDRVDQRLGKYVVHDDTLIGWSRGAFAARDILYADVAAGAAPRFTSLVLIAADVTPDPVKLRKAGIRRVFLTAGDQDGSRGTMKRATDKLNAAGIPARFASLGPIGHWLPDDFDARLAPGIAWVREK
jgi:predicted esterase